MANISSLSPSIQHQPVKPPSSVAPTAATVPSTSSTSVSTPAKTGPSSGLQAHNQSMATQQQLTSTGVSQQVAQVVSNMPSEQLQENASHLQDLSQGLMKSASLPSSASGASVSPTAPDSVPSSSPASSASVSESPKDPVSLSPRHMRTIEDMARDGKSPAEIAKHLKDPEKMPGEMGAARYSGLSEEALAKQVKDSPQFDRGSLLNTQSKQPKTAAAPAQTTSDKIKVAQVKLGQLETQLSAAQAAKSPTTVALRQQINTLKADIKAMSNVGHGPTKSEMLHKKGNVLEKLYQQATPELFQEITQLKAKKSALTTEMGRLSANLPKGAVFGPAPDVAAIRDKVDKAAEPVRKEIAAVQAEAAKIKDTASRETFVKLKMPKLEAKLESIMKPLHQANMTVSLQEKLSQSIELAGKIRQKEDTLDTAEQARGLEGERQSLKAEIAKAPESEKPALQVKLDKVDHELHGLQEQLGHGGMEWGRVKKEYLDSDRREFFMKAVIDYRQEFVLNTFKEVCSDLKKAEVGGLQKELKALETAHPPNHDAINAKKAEITKVTESWDKIDKRAVGSTDLTSDFDMTVLADRSGMDTAVMKEVNARFQQHFGKEAGSVFDTNLYVAGGGPAIKKEVKEGAKQWATPEARASHDEGQDTAALVKQRLYSTQENWDSFVQGVKGGLEQNLRALTPALSESDIQSRVDAQISRFNEADKLFKERDGKIHAGIEALKALPENHGRSHYELEITAMNRLYETESAGADKIKQDWEKLPAGAEKDQKWAEYTRADAKAQLYANEPYFSEGPVRHVVGNEQALKGLQLKGTGAEARYKLDPKTEGGKLQALQIDQVQALESLSENFGDSKKELNHLKLEGKGMGDIAIKASKYMGRLTRAIDLAIPKEAQSTGMRQTIDQLQGAEVELLRIRKGGQLPPDFKGTSEEYALKVLKDNGLGYLTEDIPATGDKPAKKAVDLLQDCFEKLALEASIQIRTGMAKASVSPAPVPPPTPQAVPEVAKPIQ